MKESPIIFNGDMVRAILDRRKTQTRRVMKPQPYIDWSPLSKQADWFTPTVTDNYGNLAPANDDVFGVTDEWIGFISPLGAVGDRLWVRETFSIVPKTAYAQSEGVAQIKSPIDKDKASIYKARFCLSEGGIRWKPSIHMPRWAARIILEITNVRVDRLHNISEQDAIAEGCLNSIHLQNAHLAYENFSWLWQSIYGDESWSSNPWVWVIEFKVLTTNGKIPQEAA